VKTDNVQLEHRAAPGEEVIQIDLKNPRLAALLAWLLPGAGHFYQGRIAKGLLFSTCILGTFIYGMYLGDAKVVYASWRPEDRRLPYICQIGVGLPALPAAVQAYRMGDRFFLGESDDPGAPLFMGSDYHGFMAPPRLMNQRVPAGSIPDKYAAEPEMRGGMQYVRNMRDELGQWQLRLNRYFELGTVYTMIAGLLNVLAIYDALGGPLVIPVDEANRRKEDDDGSRDEPDGNAKGPPGDD